MARTSAAPPPHEAEDQAPMEIATAAIHPKAANSTARAAMASMICQSRYLAFEGRMPDLTGSADRRREVPAMKTIDLDTTKLDLASVIDMARQGPLLLLTADGQEILMSLADDFDKEVEVLRRSQAFQRFLDERAACSRRIPLEDVEAEI